MLKVLVHGCNGQMGQVLTKELKNDSETTIVAGIDRNPEKFANNFPVFRDIFECKENIDIVIDFSNPYYLPGLLDYCLENKIGVVIATTGLSHQDYRNMEEVSKKIPVFYSSNMSLGINVLINLVKKAAPILQESFDIEIIEKHHNKKIDSPSGTAYMIANEINNSLNDSKEYTFGRYTKKDKRQKNEIGIHAVRGGTIVGDHEVIFAGQDEIIEIKHTATSKSIFAIGAIKAAKFLIVKNNGLYNMQNLVD